MENLSERAVNYAAEKTNELLTKAIAQAYADGYNTGYKECAEKYDIDLYEDVDFVDLDLPSGLLWSSKYRENEEGNTLYLTYEEASAFDIPTEEQVYELVDYCNWQHLMGYIGRGGYDIRQPVGKYCKSENGKQISFDDKGMKYINSNYVPQGIRFWLRDDDDGAEKKSVYIKSDLHDGKPVVTIEKKEADKALLPVMIVKR